MQIVLNLNELEYQDLKETFKEAYIWVCKNNKYSINDQLPKYLQDEVMRLTMCWHKRRNK